MTALAAPWPAAVADPQRGRRVAFEPMTDADLDAVCEVEKTAYAHPWSRRHFADSLASGHPAVMLLAEPLPGEVRLQWWRDVLAAGGSEAAGGHPLAPALLSCIARHALPLEAFEPMLRRVMERPKRSIYKREEA